MTLFTIIVGSWLCRLANWKGWWSIRTSTDSSGVRRALRPFLRAGDWVMAFTPVWVCVVSGVDIAGLLAA